MQMHAQRQQVPANADGIRATVPHAETIIPLYTELETKEHKRTDGLLTANAVGNNFFVF